MIRRVGWRRSCRCVRRLPMFCLCVSLSLASMMLSNYCRSHTHFLIIQVWDISIVPLLSLTPKSLGDFLSGGLLCCMEQHKINQKPVVCQGARRSQRTRRRLTGLKKGHNCCQHFDQRVCRVVFQASSLKWYNHVCLALIPLLWSFHLAARVSYVAG